MCGLGPPPGWFIGKQTPEKCLAPHGYHECKQTPGLWKHTTRPISFTLVVDNFGMKYRRKEDINHLLKAIKERYELTKDWDGDLYCGIRLKWDYHHCTLDISMPGYIHKQLQKYRHDCPKRPQHCPYLHCLNNMEVKPSILSPRKHLPRYQKMISNKCSESSEASSITLEPWTSPFSWPSAQLPANNQMVHKTP